MSATIKKWYDFVLQQMAAETYLNQSDLFGGPESTKNALMFGNNNPFYQRQQVYEPTKAILNGATRLTDTQATDFLSRFEVVDHRGNDDPRFAALGGNILIGNRSGLSATLLFDKTTLQYTLSVRSTEYKDNAAGGDWDRDGFFGADGELLYAGYPGVDGGAATPGKGFAFAQIAALEEYYQTLVAGGDIPAGEKINITGYSLGGHVASVFAEMHPNEVAETIVFNAPGHGGYDKGESKGSASHLISQSKGSASHLISQNHATSPTH